MSNGNQGNTLRNAGGALHKSGTSFVTGWPAVLMTLAMIVAACFAFLRPPVRSFPPTRTSPADVLTNGLAHQGNHYIVVGADGFIFTSHSPAGPWQPAKVQPQRQVALTRVRFIGKSTALAVGHSGWILRSTDAGKRWHEVAYNPNSDGSLFGVAGPFSGKLYAYGAYGEFLVSTDGGKHWKPHPLVEAHDKKKKKKLAAAGGSSTSSSGTFSPASVFGVGMLERPLNQRHIYGMAQADDGSLFLVGESGLIARSTDGAKTWHVEHKVYQGSFYGILNLPGGGLLIYGMGGHVFVRPPEGGGWRRLPVPTRQSLFAGLTTSHGRVALAGAEDTLLVSTDGGKHFVMKGTDGSSDLTAVLLLPDGRWLTSGTAHLQLWKRGTAVAAQASPRSP